jgi:hypothetical protein
LTIPKAAVLALSPNERYAYYLLGHLFNEFMFIQKLLSFTLPDTKDSRPIKIEPEMAQAFFVARVAVGKIYEVRNALSRQDLARTLADSFLPLLDEGESRLKLWQRAVKAESWMNDLRNQHAFHVPSMSDWSGALDVKLGWLDDYVYMSEQSGNVYYSGSESIAHYGMIQYLSAESPQAAIEIMLDKLTTLLIDFNGLVEDLLGCFIESKLLLQSVDLDYQGNVAGPEFSTFKIPFWTRMARKKRAT